MNVQADWAVNLLLIQLKLPDVIGMLHQSSWISARREGLSNLCCSAPEVPRLLREKVVFFFVLYCAILGQRLMTVTMICGLKFEDLYFLNFLLHISVVNCWISTTCPTRCTSSTRVAGFTWLTGNLNQNLINPQYLQWHVPSKWWIWPHLDVFACLSKIDLSKKARWALIIGWPKPCLLAALQANQLQSE